MMTQHVELAREGHVLTVKLNKPKVNALDHAMSRELGDAFKRLRDDPELRVAILTAEGDRIFSAGWDLKALDAGDAQLDEWWADGNYGEGGFAGLTENWTLNKPVVVALNGLGSMDPEGDELGFLWSQSAGPPAVLHRADTARPFFTAPFVSVGTGLVFDLVVNDGLSDSVADQVVVMVENVPEANNAPIADLSDATS